MFPPKHISQERWQPLQSPTPNLVQEWDSLPSYLLQQDILSRVKIHKYNILHDMSTRLELVFPWMVQMSDQVRQHQMISESTVRQRI